MRRAPSGSQGDLPVAVGRYRVIRVLGEGAMGRVLLAHDPVLDREVALKHLRDDLRVPREVREGLIVRMRHEARAAARVAHPNIVTLHDMCEDAELGLYLVFEYVEGPTLKDRLRDGPLSPAQAARLARELGEALTLAHGAGVVHRDVKPENIILASTGGKVADFGIARIPDSTLTHQGGLMGTPAYSAPETFRAGKFSPESDQFSLAAVMYEAISGERAFPGDDAVSVTAKIAHDHPEPIGERLGLPAIDEVLARGFSKRPEQRFPSCEAFALALARALDTSPVSSRGAPASLRGAPPAPPSNPDAFAPPPPSMAGTLDGATPAPAGRASLPSEYPPRDRRIGQVVLGAAVVVITAALLVRTALRSSDGADAADGQPAPSASAAEAPQPAHTGQRPRAQPSSKPTAKPRTEPERGAPATGTAGTGAAGEADAGTHGHDAGADAGPPDHGDAGLRESR